MIGETLEPISLHEMINSISSGHIPWNTIAVTFDDGYADNYLEALPILSEKNISATVFGISGSIGSKQELWWDFLENLLLTPGKLPRQSVLKIGEKTVDTSLENHYEYSEKDANTNAKWSVLSLSDPTPRHTLYRKLYDLLYSIQDQNNRDDCLNAIAKWAGKEHRGRESHRTLTDHELKKLSETSLIEIGGHTISHPILSRLSPEDQEYEIIEGRKELENVIDHPVSLFAYPYGDHQSYTQQTIEILKENGFKGAVTASNGTVNFSSNLFELPRITIRDWPSSRLLENLASYWRDGHLSQSV